MTKKGKGALPRTPAHSFGLKTPRDMLAKLEREFNRLAEDTFNPEEVVDHTINCAMTAWHMVDWVWELHFRGNNATLEKLAAQADIKRQPKEEERNYTPDWVKNAICQLCPAIGTCRDIANGTKHAISGHQDPAVVETMVSARPTVEFTLDSSTLGGGDVLGGPELPETQYLPKIVSNDGTRDGAIAVFDHAVQFWRSFLDEFGTK